MLPDHHRCHQPTGGIGSGSTSAVKAICPTGVSERNNSGWESAERSERGALCAEGSKGNDWSGKAASATLLGRLGPVLVAVLTPGPVAAAAGGRDGQDHCQNEHQKPRHQSSPVLASRGA